MSLMPPFHRLRDDPYPDELDQMFCETDETLCMPGRPCLCCYIGLEDQRDDGEDKENLT